MSGRPSSTLDGFPLAVKGNFLLKDVPMNTARTHLLRDHVPSQCASLVCIVSQCPYLDAMQEFLGQLRCGILFVLLFLDSLHDLV